MRRREYGWYTVYTLLEALSAKVGTLSLEAQAKLEKDTVKKELKAEAKADAALKKKLASHVRPPFFLLRVVADWKLLSFSFRSHRSSSKE